MSHRVYLGIDPGSHATGVAFLELFETSIVAIKSYCIKSQEFKGHDDNHHYDRLYISILQLLYQFSPCRGAIEKPFISGKSPTAIIPLAKANETIERAIRAYDPTLVLEGYSPRHVKARLNTMDHQSKDAILQAVLSQSNLSPYIKPTMTEHEIDAIAVAYVLYKNQIGETCHA